MKELANLSDFEAFIKSNPKVIIDFYATWCGPCKNIAPVLEDYASKNSDIAFAKVDVDANEDAASVCNVEAMPTMIAFHNGTQFSKFEGANPNKLADLVAKLKNA